MHQSIETPTLYLGPGEGYNRGIKSLLNNKLSPGGGSLTDFEFGFRP